MKLRFVCVCLLLTALPLRAEVTHSGEHGFTVSHTVTTSSDPFVVYRTMTSHIDQWWDGVVGEQLTRLAGRLAPP